MRGRRVVAVVRVLLVLVVGAGVWVMGSGCAMPRAEATAAPPDATAKPERARTSRYDAVYEKGEAFSRGPNAFLGACVAEIVADRKGEARALSALDVGMGQGRNSVMIAQHGLSVTGFDVSEVGVAMARENAAAAGVQIEALVANARTFDYGVDRWDVVSLMYYQPPVEAMERLRTAVAVGGSVIIERYASDSFWEEPVRTLRMFEGWRVRRLEYGVYESDWTWGREGPPTATVLRVWVERVR